MCIGTVGFKIFINHGANDYNIILYYIILTLIALIFFVSTLPDGMSILKFSVGLSWAKNNKKKKIFILYNIRVWYLGIYTNRMPKWGILNGFLFSCHLFQIYNNRTP